MSGLEKRRAVDGTCTRSRETHNLLHYYCATTAMWSRCPRPRGSVRRIGSVGRSRRTRPSCTPLSAETHVHEDREEEDRLPLGFRSEEFGHHHLGFPFHLESRIREGKVKPKGRKPSEFHTPITARPQEVCDFGGGTMNHFLGLLGIDGMKCLMDYQIHAVLAIHRPADSDRRLGIIGMSAVSPTVGGDLSAADEMDMPFLATEFGGHLVGILLALLPRHGGI